MPNLNSKAVTLIWLLTPTVTFADHILPHAAAYTFELNETKAISNVSLVSGELVFELTGDNCNGYTLQTQLQTLTIFKNNEKMAYSYKSTTWESPQATEFRFSNQEAVDSKVTGLFKGSARRPERDAPLEVDLDLPERKQLSIKQRLNFPFQHMREIISAGTRGQKVVKLDLFDGSRGADAFSTSVAIERAATGGIQNSWHTTVQYRHLGEYSDQLPPIWSAEYIISADGVIRDLVIDYGHYSIRGEIKKLDMLPTATCGKGPAGHGHDR